MKRKRSIAWLDVRPLLRQTQAMDAMDIAVAVIQHAGRVLVGQRGPGAKLAGLWEFPGGKLQPGEDARAAALRECREETGLEVCLLHLLLETTHAYDYATLRLHFFAAEPTDPAQTPLAPFRWIPIAELEAQEFPPANAPVIAGLLANCAAKK